MGKVKTRKRSIKKIFYEKGKNSKLGYISMGIAILAFIIILVSIHISHMAGGNANHVVGSLGLISLFISIAGLVIGCKGFKEEDKLYWPCYVGSISSGTVLIFMIIIYAIGV